MNAIQAGIGVNTVVVRNPATDKVIGEIACLSAPEINAAVARAAAAQPRWGATPVSQRLQVLRKFQRLLAQQKDAVASVITREAGKPKVEALSTEILVVLDAVNFLLANVAAFLRPEAVPHANPVMKLKRGRLLRQPYGVVGIISPWNYPFSIPSVQTLAALATGNAVVLKPSPETLSGFVENNVLSRLNSTSRCTLCAFESFQLQFIPASPELALCVEGFCLWLRLRRAVFALA